MRLLTGPPGSGKTSVILERLREAVRAGDRSIRLLTPTATMARHLQNRLAREGAVLVGKPIQTFSGFVENWAGDLRQVPEATLYLIVEEAARRVDRPEFARVARLPGFCASLARTMAEFSSAGCDSARLAASLPESPLAAAFLAVYREVDRELERRGLALRARRLELAAERIEREGLAGIREIWFDGFHALPDPELRVIAALDKHAEVTIALAEVGQASWPADAERKELVAERQNSATQGSQSLGRPGGLPHQTLFRAPSIEREADEIARRILAQAAAGRPFREIGIIVRAVEAYVPVLRSTLGRCGIPARFYFDSDLQRHAAVRFVTGAMDAMLSGWDHERTLAALRLAPRFVDSPAMDRFDFAVREQVPNAGLGALKALLLGTDGHPFSTGAERVLRKIERLAALEEWRSFALAPKDWAARMRELRGLFRPARPAEGAGHERALEWREQAAALDAFEEALDEAAEALDPALLIEIGEFWRAVKSVLRLKPLRLDDLRRNVVHVLSAPEARQWRLPVVFICGLTEKQFPQFHRQDPFFPDEARRKLNDAGIRVRTAAEFEREERALFDSAITRATEAVILSYPEYDSRGERNLPSLFLEDLEIKTEEQIEAPNLPVTGQAARPAPLLQVRTPEHLEYLRERTQYVSPTALETYLQCPFQYFAGRMLRLARRPPRPEQRLDFIVQGEIVHEALASWRLGGGDIDALFEAIFARRVEEGCVPAGYHTERLRNAMFEDLQAFAADGQWPRDGFESKIEQDFMLDLGEARVRGKIDRLDVDGEGRAFVIDYKYSSAQRTKDRLKDENLLQAPLYVLAAEKFFGVRPAGMFYLGLKRGPLYAGWSNDPPNGVPALPIPEGWLDRAIERTLQAVGEIRAGRMEPGPAMRDSCRLCDCRDVCRANEAAFRPAGAMAEGA